MVHLLGEWLFQRWKEYLTPCVFLLEQPSQSHNFILPRYSEATIFSSHDILLRLKRTISLAQNFFDQEAWKGNGTVTQLFKERTCNYLNVECLIWGYQVTGILWQISFILHSAFLLWHSVFLILPQYHTAAIFSSRNILKPQYSAKKETSFLDAKELSILETL